MKDINRFFYRLDQIKKVLLLLCIPAAIACWFFPVGFLALLTIGPLSHIGIVVGIFPIHIPKDTEITKAIQERHTAYRSQVARELKAEEDELSLLEGFSEEKAYLGRREGSRMIYPVCRTVIFLKRDAILQILVKDTSLLTPGAKESSWQISKSEPIHAVLKKQKNKIIKLTLTCKNDTVTVLLQDKYTAQDLLEKYRSYIIVDKETIHTL
ncbi:MAG: hypothetical protein IJY20_05165 [Clostridia bacterium]|nr:hypothetical protein [Clostridia bacterium]